jgi:hypothetical protein
LQALLNLSLKPVYPITEPFRRRFIIFKFICPEFEGSVDKSIPFATDRVAKSCRASHMQKTKAGRADGFL